MKYARRQDALTATRGRRHETRQEAAAIAAGVEGRQIVAVPVDLLLTIILLFYYFRSVEFHGTIS